MTDEELQAAREWLEHLDDDEATLGKGVLLGWLAEIDRLRKIETAARNAMAQRVQNAITNTTTIRKDMGERLAELLREAQ